MTGKRFSYLPPIDMRFTRPTGKLRVITAKQINSSEQSNRVTVQGVSRASNLGLLRK